MATKKGMLSDKAMMVNCVDYKALPVGFANAEFQGNMSNPYLQGIKTSKYQRAAPKPASADVVAVSNARFIAGNRANNARLILDQYQKEAKEFKPPPVNLAKITRGNKDSRSRGRKCCCTFRTTKIIKKTTSSKSYAVIFFGCFTWRFNYDPNNRSKI